MASAPIVPIDVARITSDAIIRRRRSIRSVRTPPKITNTTNGAVEQPATMP
ncbi:MAG TPA: hypothetical protein VIL92_00710 [Gaiellaceae bacterium]